jgi:hypothetical protein
MRSTLKSWGNAKQSVNLALQPNAQTNGRVYVGHGDTIGQATGRALNALTLNDIKEEEIVLL